MTTDRKLAWLCVALSIIGLIPAFHESSLWVSVCVVLVACASAYLAWSEYQLNQGASTLLAVERTLVIHDAAGRTATLNQTRKVRVNIKFLHEMWFRNMVADGVFGPVTIDGKAPDLTTRMGCLVSHCRRFEPPLTKGAQRTITLTCNVQDSFMANKEGMSHDVAQDTKLLVFKVILPAGRPCLSATMIREAGGEPNEPLDHPNISHDRLTIDCEIKNPRTGYTYNLEWEW